jgi:phosphoserine aminotransferase
MKSTYANFAAGPAQLPSEVKKNLLIAIEPNSYIGSKPLWADGNQSRIPGDTLPLDLSLLETSHRSKRIEWIIQDTKERLKALLIGSDSDLSNQYDILFMQGGASLQFTIVLLNLFPDIFIGTERGQEIIGDYIITGTWSEKAACEAKNLSVQINDVLGTLSFPNRAIYDLSAEDFEKQLKFSENSKFIYYCENETIQGFKIPSAMIRKQIQSKKKLVICDMSSSFLTETVDLNLFDVIFASAQKNLGIPGVTVVIVRRELLTKSSLPPMLSYRITADHVSAYNTPPVLSIYSINLMARFISDTFGNLNTLAEYHRQLAFRLYDCIQKGNLFYKTIVKDPYFRSLTNICWALQDEKLESEFNELLSAQSEILEIGGHRSVGGYRASLYNGSTELMVQKLCNFLTQFRMSRSL